MYEYSNDIEEKLNKFSSICGTINRHLKSKTRKETQVKFYKTITVPTLTYGSMIWTTTRKSNSRTRNEISKMNQWRYTRLDTFRNKDIRTELNIYSLHDRIRQHRTR